ncbi:CHAT domain-containing protein [Duganella levis]|uniref:CHAT domain-containing protein n=1 Tax=Duganella levis TaxID=2692169 RepID=A0ABW9VZ44_9BURK|nr:CHAT domain-containing protein [Duganella levis]MYN26933.1 CHAT domain-containing protein [Duganella levis]
MLASAPAHAQLEWMQKAAGKAAGAFNPRVTKLEEYAKLMSMHDYPGAAAIAEALVKDDLTARDSLLNVLNRNNSNLQQSAGMAAQAQAGAKNYARAIELLQIQLDAVPELARRVAPAGLLQPKLELARLYGLIQQPEPASAIYRELLASPSMIAGIENDIHSRYGQLALEQRDWATAEQQLLLAIDGGTAAGTGPQGMLAGLAGVFGATREMAVALNDTLSISDASGQVVMDTSEPVIAKEMLEQHDPLLGLAELYWRTGRSKDVADLYQRRFRKHVEAALTRIPAALRQAGSANRKLELEYARMATLLAASGRDDLATEALNQALQLNADRLQAMQKNTMPEALGASMRVRRELLALALSLQLRQPLPAGKDMAEVIGLLLQSKSLHSELLAERVQAVALSPDADVHRLWERLNELQDHQPGAVKERGELSVKLLARIGPQLRIAELGQGADFITALRRQLQTAGLWSVSAYTPFDFTRQEFSSPRYLGVLIGAKDLKFADLGEVTEIDRQVTVLRADLSAPPTPGARPPIPAAARQLYQQLLQPLFGKQLPAGAYLAVLDGALGLLPVEALADANGHYLIDSTEWRYLSSARVLLRERAAGSHDGRALVMASPGFDTALPAAGAARTALAPALRSMRFAALPETLDEGRAVATALSRNGTVVELLSGEQATAERLQASHGPRYLHIASHGFFLEEAGTELVNGKGRDGQAYTQATFNSGTSSGIALAGANRGVGGDGHGEGLLLTAQLRQLDLHGTELAVLSACETGVGSPRIGESIESLRQALEVAGAQSTVTSLWRVASVETRDTMAAFYDNLGKGRGKAAALRQAKLSIKNKQAHPFYWAPFIITGAD